jgi:hypothetical protein
MIYPEAGLRGIFTKRLSPFPSPLMERGGLKAGVRRKPKQSFEELNLRI